MVISVGLPFKKNGRSERCVAAHPDTLLEALPRTLCWLGRSRPSAASPAGASAETEGRLGRFTASAAIARAGAQCVLCTWNMTQLIFRSLVRSGQTAAIPQLHPCV